MKPDTLHHPLLAGLPQPPSTAHFDLRLALLILLTLLLVGLFARLRRTSHFHPDYAARTDMTRLLALVCGGLLVEWTRSRLDEFTPGFWFASFVLLPFVIGAITLSLRLFRAYRTPAQPASRSIPLDAVSALPKSTSTAPKGGRR